MHRIYGAMIITALAHLFAEQGALYTLTHVDTVPAWITRGIHQVFLLLFLVLFCEVYLYIPAMIADETKEPIKKAIGFFCPSPYLRLGYSFFQFITDTKKPQATHTVLELLQSISVSTY